jgi:hypothetical protein
MIDVMNSDLASRALNCSSPPSWGHGTSKLSTKGRRSNLCARCSELFANSVLYSVQLTIRSLIKQLRPVWFVMENAPGLTNANNIKLLQAMMEAFRDIGYETAADVLLAADFGVPQLRYRLFLIGTRTGAPIRFPKSTHRSPVPKLGAEALGAKPRSDPQLPVISPGRDRFGAAAHSRGGARRLRRAGRNQPGQRVRRIGAAVVISAWLVFAAWVALFVRDLLT